VDPKPLFAKSDLGAVLSTQERNVIEAAQQIPAAHALAATVEELAAELVEKFKVEPLLIDWEAMTLSHHDAQIEAGAYGWRSGKIPGTRYTYHMPFKGDEGLFECRPTTWTSVFPYAVVSSHELQVSTTVPASGESDPKAELNSEVGKIKQYVGWVNKDVEAFGPRLLRVATTSAQARHEKVVHDKEVADSFGLPQKP
jgi:hypothetical protein